MKWNFISYIKKKGRGFKTIGIHLAMETSYIIPYFSRNAANFSISMGPGSILKKVCESPAKDFSCFPYI